ncbi:MAG TPA: hypothetical protein VJR89_43805, partial [Polyangiales bacterium]|nr:hypothetical protein [Polyangiales bacterium]
MARVLWCCVFAWACCACSGDAEPDRKLSVIVPDAGSAVAADAAEPEREQPPRRARDAGMPRE